MSPFSKENSVVLCQDTLGGKEFMEDALNDKLCLHDKVKLKNKLGNIRRTFSEVSCYSCFVAMGRLGFGENICWNCMAC